MRQFFILLIILLAMASGVYATDYFVRPDGPVGAGDGTTWADAWDIASAFASNGLAAGDRVIIAPGKYVPGGVLGSWGTMLAGTAGNYIEFIGDRSGYMTSVLAGVAHSAVTTVANTSYGTTFQGKVLLDFTGAGTGIELAGDEYIKIRNLELFGGSYNGMWLRTNGTDFTNNIVIENCIIHTFGYGGIEFEGHDIKFFNCLVYNTGSRAGGAGGISSGWDGSRVWNITVENCTSVMNANRGIHITTTLGGCWIKNSISFQPDDGVDPQNRFSHCLTLQDESPATTVGIDSGCLNTMTFATNNIHFSIDDTGGLYNYWGTEKDANSGYNAGDEMPGILNHNYYWHKTDAANDTVQPFAFQIWDGDGNLNANVDLYDYVQGGPEFGNNPVGTNHDWTGDDFRLFIDNYVSWGYGSVGLTATGTMVNGGTGSARKLGFSTLTTFAEDPEITGGGNLTGYVLDGDLQDFSETALLNELNVGLMTWTDRATDNAAPLPADVVFGGNFKELGEVDGTGTAYIDSEPNYADPDIVNLGYHWVPYNAAGYSTVDEDLDGIPDSWENLGAHTHLDPQDPTDAATDFDGDGYTELQEYLLNKNPIVPDAPDADFDGLDDRWEQFYDPQRDGDDLVINANEIDHFSGTGASGTDTDVDGDGMRDQEEHDQAAATNAPDPYNATTNPTGTDVNPTVADTDGDGLSDDIETDDGTFNDAVADSGTSPVNPDTDGDGMPDGWEAGAIIAFTGFGADGAAGGGDDVNAWLDPLDDGSTDVDQGPAGDPDADIVTTYNSNLSEYQLGTDPTDGSSGFTDVDADGIDDNWETGFAAISNITQLGEDGTGGSGGGTADYDGDGLTDFAEWTLYIDDTILNAVIDPTNNDSDGDTLLDGEETAAWTGSAWTLGTYTDANDTGSIPTSTDSDGDGMLDGWEVLYLDVFTAPVFNPSVDDTGNGNCDPSADPDGDTLSNALESTMGTNPNASDTDGDGMPDNTDPSPLVAPKASSGSGGGGCVPATGAGLLLVLLPLIFFRRKDS